MLVNIADIRRARSDVFRKCHLSEEMSFVRGNVICQRKRHLSEETSFVTGNVICQRKRHLSQEMTFVRGNVAFLSDEWPSIKTLKCIIINSAGSLNTFNLWILLIFGSCCPKISSSWTFSLSNMAKLPEITSN